MRERLFEAGRTVTVKIHSYVLRRQCSESVEGELIRSLDASIQTSFKPATVFEASISLVQISRLRSALATASVFECTCSF